MNTSVISLTQAVVVYILCMEPLRMAVKQLDGLYRKPCQVLIGFLKSPARREDYIKATGNVYSP